MSLHSSPARGPIGFNRFIHKRKAGRDGGWHQQSRWRGPCLAPPDTGTFSWHRARGTPGTALTPGCKTPSVPPISTKMPFRSGSIRALQSCNAAAKAGERLWHGLVSGAVPPPPRAAHQSPPAKVLGCLGKDWSRAGGRLAVRGAGGRHEGVAAGMESCSRYRE